MSEALSVRGLGHGHEEFYAVEQVGFGTAALVIDGHEIDVGIKLLQALEDTSADDVVGQAAERLQAEALVMPSEMKRSSSAERSHPSPA